MSNIAVNWMTDNSRLFNSRLFACRDSIGNLVMAGSPPNGWINDRSFQATRATDLLLMSLATCAAHEVVDILERQRQKLTELRVDVDAHQQPEPPHAFKDIHMQFHLAGEQLDPGKVSRALELSVDKYCPVAATLRGVVSITYGFEIDG